MSEWVMWRHFIHWFVVKLPRKSIETQCVSFQTFLNIFESKITVKYWYINFHTISLYLHTLIAILSIMSAPENFFDQKKKKHHIVPDIIDRWTSLYTLTLQSEYMSYDDGVTFQGPIIVVVVVILYFIMIIIMRLSK